MRGKSFALSMAVLWAIVFGGAMHSIPLGICLGLCMGVAFGLFRKEKDFTITDETDKADDRDEQE